MKPNLVAVHLLNDRSGSPLVFSQALDFLQEEYAVQLYTSTPSGDGFLTDLSNVQMHTIPYRWWPAKWRTLLHFFWVQCWLFTILLVRLKKTDTVYINTLLPFGAALAGRLRGCRVIYHVHELSIRPVLLKKILRCIADNTAKEVLFVSHYLSRQFHFRRATCRVLHNALPASWSAQAVSPMPEEEKNCFTVLMLCSLKAYKGVDGFVQLARLLPALRFVLVLNASVSEVEQFRHSANPPANCRLFPCQQHTLVFYKNAHLVVNLSDPSKWVETFGMTILEAMSCSLPVIVPPVGGVLELIDDGVEGFSIDPKELDLVKAAIEKLAGDKALYSRMALQAGTRAGQFSIRCFQDQLQLIFSSCTGFGKTVHLVDNELLRLQ